ncbi:uncharacterized protein L3040_001962 [Drepanopeziza brunnea f. sp. 'multigermtubi']|uniref:Beta-tubulin cofactor d n=1 Tax=Marssonina brunnea f. sp. multigermtubi (strain MB_m1) TaxID=1072389 RepID=K1X3A4_MARBU|nr:beta-tubulin cofactor d [Drepanopeziza brunnea f. sp. 'multigermtubi' MB_m1]EKD19691.1 beta-tubulin cofactor d [Drepanopeziza brunnea f. sp. 'multigermtubi' MB_m1]KAJ5052203.1 hypothetical protein L3040_001962 [Drepanopeziza brunnea f. sp. 'multigermtubi']
MDAPEIEQDVQLERSAPTLLADLGQSLEPFLRKYGHIRRNVRLADTDRLVNLLEPFQELPQLLDPHLKAFVPLLARAFIEYLQTPPKNPSHTHLLIPLSKAICKLLYTFCKIRGEKVIVQFLSTETRHLELLLSALEEGSQDEAPGSWCWEERYIALLWLSQLLLAPFDLASISSRGTEDIVKLNIPGLICPPNVPAVTTRVIFLAVNYLSSSGKERDAAKTLLVRVAMRPDMQQVGVLRALVEWALSCLNPASTLQTSPYYYIGVLSFVAGLLVSSAGTPDMVSYVPAIFDITRDQDDMPTAILDAIKKSAVSRKIIIKIFRAIAVLELSNPQLTDLDRVQTLIGDLLDSLEDSATPVRLAASKALSIITLRLDSDMASQVVDVVLDTFHGTYRTKRGLPDLSDVKPFQWHGLVLTFSHLLYRRSIPSARLPPVLNALRLALSFEKRSTTSATSTGTNVRDAANFGIWAVARRYSTAELQAINLDSLDGSVKSLSALQTLATDLIISGSLDPAGNVRRGSSAALQELIGRNPDTILQGITVVQVVDYHAIALRSRAVEEVAIQAAALSEGYYDGLLDGLLSWRGLKDTDAAARRIAASAVGKMVWAKRLRSRNPWEGYRKTLSLIAGRMVTLGVRDSDERHGLVLCLASIMKLFTEDMNLSASHGADETIPMILEITAGILKYVNEGWAAVRNQELIAEATCQLFLATKGLLEAENQAIPHLIAGQMSAVEKFMTLDGPIVNIVSDAVAELMTLVSKDEMDALIKQYIYKSKTFSKGRHASKNGAYLHAIFKVFPVTPRHQQAILSTIQEIWTQDPDIDTRVTILRCLAPSPIIRTKLDSVFRLIEEGLDDFTTNAQGDVGSKVRIEAAKVVRSVWASTTAPDHESEIRTRLCGRVLRTAAEKLDRVRREGQRCLLLNDNELSTVQTLDPSSTPYFRILLDIQCLPWYSSSPHASTWSETFLSGYVISADAGAEKLVQASRSALLDFCEASPSNCDLTGQTLLAIIKSNVQSSNDRILVSALEVMRFLFDMGVMQQSSVDWKDFFLWVQKAHYQSTNIRKIEVCVRLYGGLVEMGAAAGVGAKAAAKMVGMLVHRYPSVRSVVADELWVRRGLLGLKGVDWGRAQKGDLEGVRMELAAM